ncbi:MULTISPECIES: hypothetical protein [Pandoraea]|uniref:hypothetical protein n=1 Tax=Pandoraea TaxID=93217 RepID=UPI001F5C46F0|nr:MULTISPECIES: hypothetical protein [Pandoraea]MCI3204669.1 hypothetical protein [Pandoraea sp. LA3]MDN4582697.1 hypothetical protein [Pandoraea capi]
MFKITVSTTRRAIFCVAAACIANTAQADVNGLGSIGGAVPVAVSDALLASTHAANLQRSLVTSIGNAAPAALAPAHSTTISTANNVRLWDEVIPPAPSPKPTQASLPPSAQPRTIVAVSASQPMPQVQQAPSTMMATSFKANAGAVVTRMQAGPAR